MRRLPVLLLLLVTSARADVDELFARWNRPGSPGVAVAVVRDGKVVFAKGYGFAQLEYDVPVGPETVFHVASVSKQFTGFAVARLAAQGKLSLDNDIRKHLPEMHDFGATITVRHLLHHTSGLRDQWQLLAIAGWRLDDVITMDHIRTMMWNQRELNFPPGARSLYCNSGYTLAAEIVARVAKVPFKEYCRKEIFEPLGMKHTHFHDDHTHIVKNRAYSYAPSGDGFRKAVLSYANAGATSLFTTAVDLTKWLANLADGKVGGRELIASLQEPAVLADGTKPPYGFGLALGEHRGHKTLAHGGADAGFRSFVVWFPDSKLGVVVLSNGADCPTSRLAYAVADLQLGLEPPPPPPETRERAPAEIDTKVYAAYAGRYAVENGPPVTITHRDGRLFVTVPGLGEGELFPASQTRFFLRVHPAEVTFDAPKDGRSPGLTVHMGPRNQRGVRTAEQEPAPVAAYAGTYASDELGTHYELVAVDGALVARHRRHGDIPLQPAGKDRFRGTLWFFRQVRFERDAKGELTGFRLSGGRVLNLWFARR